MMRPAFEVVQAGLGNTIQDEGRRGFRHQGVPVSGWLDAELAHCANALVGNAPDAAALEMRSLGPTLQLLGGMAQIAVCGQVSVRLKRAGGLVQEPGAWCSMTMYPGDVLLVGPVIDGCAYLACAGSWDLPAHMGSRSTYARVGLGGLHGRALQSGDQLPFLTSPTTPLETWRAEAPFAHEPGPIRLMPGPQANHFHDAALQALVQCEWQASAAQDRMGIRLRGQPLTHARQGAADIVSDAVTPGAIQVPADGQPIVLLADCQTMGGYPKIAVVIAADLPRLAHLPAGSACRFAWVDAAQAREACAQAQAAWLAWRQGIRRYKAAAWVDEDNLLGQNLIDGMIDVWAKE